MLFNGKVLFVFVRHTGHLFFTPKKAKCIMANKGVNIIDNIIINNQLLPEVSLIALY